MPDQDPDLSDPDQWLADFKSSLPGLGAQVDPSIAASAPPAPGLLGSREDLDAIVQAANGQSDPTASVTTAQRAPSASGALPYHSVPSPHAGHYGTLDEAAKAAASDVPRNADAEYEAFFPERRVTNNIDLGDGFGPQSISLGDGYDYGGLYTSGDNAKVSGPAPPNVAGWFHNHPWDFDPSVNEANKRPSTGSSYDEGTINQLHNITQ